MAVSCWTAPQARLSMRRAWTEARGADLAGKREVRAFPLKLLDCLN